MRILLISHGCQSATEGQPKAEWLARIPGVELCVLTPDRWMNYGRWREPQIPKPSCGYRYEVGTVRTPWLGPAQYYLHSYSKLGRLIRDFQPDLIDLWEEPWALVSAQTCWLRDRVAPQCKVISETEQNVDRTLPPPFESFRSFVLRRTDFAVGRSEEAVDVLRSRGYQGPAEVVPNGVDHEMFRPLDRAACRRKLGVGEFAGFVAGYVGRLVPQKGLLDFVAALKRCPPEVHAVLIGDGPMKDELHRAADEPELAGRLHLLPARPLKELPTIMNALDVLVLPSRTTERWKEQFGRVLIEANACGTPVIGSESGAIPDVVGNGGLVFPEGDAPALANAILRLANDPDEARRVGEAGRHTVKKRYTWQRVAERMHKIYERVLDSDSFSNSEQFDDAELAMDGAGFRD